jgi:hypothetical protein
MPEGYDHDFELPPSAFRTIFRRLAARWPEGIAQLYGGVLIPFAAVADRALDTLGDGFSAYRSAAARERSHDEGGFVDADGESFLEVLLMHCDTTRLEIDLVFDNNGSPAFSLVVHEAVGRGISKALGANASPEWAPMNHAWHARTVATLNPYLLGGAAVRERADFIALACWHRVRYEDEPHLTYTQPPGRLTVVDGRIYFEPDNAGPSPNTRPWGFNP